MEFVIFDQKDQIPDQWTEFRPRPQSLSAVQMITRMVYNPARNEALFIASCAERLIKDETEYGTHSTNEIVARIEQDISKGLIVKNGRYLQFRLAFISRDKEQIVKHVLYVSDIIELKRGAAS